MTKNQYKLSLILFAILFSGFNFASYDDYFLLSTGRAILENGFFKNEIFSMHDNLNIIIPQWIFSVILYGLYEFFGFYSIIVLMCICSIIIVLLLFEICCVVSDNKKMSFIVTFISFMIPIGPFLECRPQLISYICILLTILLLEKYIRLNKWNLLIPIPFIFILQINSHATMLVFLYAAIFPYLLNFKFMLGKNIIESYSYKKIPIIFITIISTFCTLINPYGIDAPLYLFKSASSGVVTTSGEMAASTINNGGLILYALLIILIVILYKYKNCIECHLLLLLFGSFIVGLFAQRNIVLITFSLPVFICCYLKNREINIKTKIRPNIFLSALAVGLIFNIVFGSQWSNLKVEYSGIKNYIVENIDNYEDLNFYSDTESGSYLQFYNIHTFIDNRREVYLKAINGYANILNDYSDLQEGKISFDKLNEIYNFDYAVITEKDFLYDVIEEQNVTFLFEYKNGKNYNCRLYKVN